LSQFIEFFEFVEFIEFVEFVVMESDFYSYYLDRINRIFRIYFYSLFLEETKNTQSPVANLMLSKFDINQFENTI
jgi:hypothetical protein